MKISRSVWGLLLVSWCSLRTLACAFHPKMPPRDRRRRCLVKALKERGDKEDWLLKAAHPPGPATSLAPGAFHKRFLHQSSRETASRVGWRNDIMMLESARCLNQTFSRGKVGETLVPLALRAWRKKRGPVEPHYHPASWIQSRGHQRAERKRGLPLLTGLERGHGRLRADDENLHCTMIWCS